MRHKVAKAAHVKKVAARKAKGGRKRHSKKSIVKA